MSRVVLFQKHGISMPLKKLALWLVLHPWWHPYSFSFQLEIVLPIVEICFEPPTDSKLKIRADSYIPTVKQSVNIGTKEKAVANIMLATLRDGSDMSSL